MKVTNTGYFTICIFVFVLLVAGCGQTKELYDFCPDIVDQGTGTMEALKLEITRTRELYLWWD